MQAVRPSGCLSHRASVFSQLDRGRGVWITVPFRWGGSRVWITVTLCYGILFVRIHCTFFSSRLRKQYNSAEAPCSAGEVGMILFFSLAPFMAWGYSLQWGSRWSLLVSQPRSTFYKVHIFLFVLDSPRTPPTSPPPDKEKYQIFSIATVSAMLPKYTDSASERSVWAFINSLLFPLINIILLFPVPYPCPRELGALSVFPLWGCAGLIGSQASQCLDYLFRASCCPQDWRSGLQIEAGGLSLLPSRSGWTFPTSCSAFQSTRRFWILPDLNLTLDKSQEGGMNL